MTAALVASLNHLWEQGQVQEGTDRLLTLFLQQKHGLEVSCLHFVRKGSNLTFRDETPYFVKCFPPGNRYRFIRETYGLSQLNTVLPVQIPGVVAQGSIDEWDYLVLTGLPGYYLRDVWPTLSQSNKCNVAAQLGTLIACLHQTPFEPLTVFGLQPKEIRAREDSFAHKVLTVFPQQLYQAGLTPQWLDICLAGIQTELKGIQTEAVLVHRHLAPQHILVAQDSDICQMTGLVDFDGLMCGPPAAEFVGPVIGLYHETEVLQTLFTHYGFIRPHQRATFARQLLAFMLVDTRFEPQWLVPIIQHQQPRSWAELSQAVCYFLTYQHQYF